MTGEEVHGNSKMFSSSVCVLRAFCVCVCVGGGGVEVGMVCLEGILCVCMWEVGEGALYVCAFWGREGGHGC